MLIVESRNLDVFYNLAIEEYLMDFVQDRGPILFLWRSACAVVMGKNQNPWRECRLDLMEAEGVPLARRISGGGTVYHDEGNLNYCVITGREAYREEQAYGMVFQALETLGIHAEKSGKSNLCVNGLKFSGNAFSFRRGRALHHGTLLNQTNLARLNRYLGTMFEHIETHAIASVPANVMNLNLDMDALAEALKVSFKSVYQDGVVGRWSDAEIERAIFEPLLDRQTSNDWKFSATPGFVLNDNGIELKVARGVVVGGKYAGKSFREVAFSLVC